MSNVEFNQVTTQQIDLTDSELCKWLGDWPSAHDEVATGSEQAEAQIIDLSKESQYEPNKNSLFIELEEAKQAISRLSSTLESVKQFSTGTREQLEGNKKIYEQFGEFIEDIIFAHHVLGMLIEKERPVVTAAEASQPFLDRQIADHSADYELVSQYLRDLELLERQKSAIEDNISLNEEIINSRNMVPKTARDPRKNLEDTHVTAAIERRGRAVLSDELEAKDLEIEELTNKIQETTVRIKDQADKQNEYSIEAQINRETIINQAEKAVTDALLKLGRRINQNQAISNTMMRAALEAQQDERAIES
ncbi:hypothetical protein H6794_02505 [Candidatus Nomurabacteria bacterium]|nr:hypothetical protein [Candidatus Saccharibacteria bacterium]MCB9839702.1 hypothetical protein [Candidatus Nomurabacteria bacterium]